MDLRNPKIRESAPAAVLMDFDNTVYPYDPAHAKAMHYVCGWAAREFAIKESDFQEAFDRGRREIKDQLGRVASSHNRLLYFKRTLELIGLGSQLKVALDLEQMYWRTFFSQIEMFPGVIEFLEELRLAAIPLAIVTDLTAQIQLRKIVYLGLDHYLDVVVTSEESGADKPDARLFRTALEKLSVKHGPVWYVGDDPVADMQGARESVGALTFQKVHHGVVRAVDHAIPDASFTHFEELTGLLRQVVNAPVARAR